MSKKVQQYKNNYLIKQLPSATAFFNKKLILLHASDKWIKDLDLDMNEVFGKSISQLFQNTENPFLRKIKACLSGFAMESYVQIFHTSENEIKWFEWNMNPWFNEKEDIIGIIIDIRDVTDKVDAVNKSEKLRSLLNEKSEIAKIGSWSLQLDAMEVHWCAMTKKIHEVPLDYLPTVENGIQYFAEGHSRNTISMAIQNAIYKGKPWNEKLQIITANNTTKWVISAGKPLLLNGEVVSLSGTFQDIDEQVTTNFKIRENERLLRTVIDNLPLNVFIKDLDSRKTLVNKAECEFIGVQNPAELIGKNDFDLYPKEIAEILRKEDVFIMSSLKPLLGKEKTIIKKDGTSTTVLTSKLPLIGNDGMAKGLVGISMNISDIKQKEDDFKKLIKVTSQQNNKLMNFAHIVSHNLRSHSANFSMLLSFLQKEENRKEQINLVQMLVSASDNLLSTLDNLNEVVTINTNTGLVKKKVVLRKAIQTVTENLTAVIQGDNAQVINRVSDKIKIAVIPAYLESILMNIISNAIRYKHADRDPIIDISVSTKKNCTVLSIRDNGIGIDLKEHGKKVFGMYKTFHSNPDARGIGLYLSKNQIEAMNGKINVNSEVDKGTTFNILFS